MRLRRIAMIAGVLAYAAAATAASGRAEIKQAQQPLRDAPATGVIAGRVVDAVSGNPVAKAVLQLTAFNESGPLLSLRRESDDTGHFEFSLLPAGTFSLYARADGYVFGGYGALAYHDFARNKIELHPAERLTAAVVHLWPQARISGGIVDERDEPAVGLIVRFLRREHVAGRFLWRSAGDTSTDDRGQFSKQSQPGDYIVVAPAERPVAGPAESFDRGDVAPRAVFYDAARSVSAASVIRLGPGDTRANVNLTVSLAPPSHLSVSGRIVSREKRSPFILHLVPREADESVAHIEGLLERPAQDGSFTFRHVPPGDYRLRATVFPVLASGVAATVNGDVMRWGRPLLSPPETPTLVADLPVSVTQSIDDLEVVLQPGARIDGRVLVEGRSDSQGSHPLTGATIFVFPEYPDTRDPGLRIPAVGVDKAGRFQTVGLPAGKYFFNASAYVESTSYALTSVHLGGRELLGVGVDVGATDLSDVVLSFTARRWSLSGAVRDRSGQPVPSASVIVFPRDRSRWQMVGFSTAVNQLVTDRSGIFQASGALTGD